jgi:methyl-accepting chemotaxis protein
MLIHTALAAALQAAASIALPHDTLIVRTVSPERSTVEHLFFWASGLTSILALVLLAALIAWVIWLRRALADAGRRVDELFDELRPMIQQAGDVSTRISKTVDLVHDEVVLVKAGVHESSERVKHTVGELADRVDDFNELLGKVHRHADSVVTVAGAAVEGLAWGADKLRERKSRKRPAKKS